MRRLSSLLLTVALATPQPGRAESFTTVDVIRHSFSPQCLDYCIVGACFWLTCGLTGCRVVTTPKVRHNWPDLVVTAYGQPGDTPWTELRATLGEASRLTGNTLIRALTGIDIGGGDLTENSRRRLSDLRFREVDVIGSPMVLLTRAAGSLAALANAAPDTDSGSAVNDWGADPSGLGEASTTLTQIGTTAGTAQHYGGIASLVAPQLAGAVNAAGQVATVANTLSSVTETLSAIDTLASAGSLGLGFSIGSPFCPSQAAPFQPYFQSTIDALAWRTGFPDQLMPDALIPGRREIGNWPTQTWGAVYPRSGFVTQTDEVKASAVAAQRAIDVVTRDGTGHLHLPLHYDGHREVTFGSYSDNRTQCIINGGNWRLGDGEGNGDYCAPRRVVEWLSGEKESGKRWQMISPAPSEACEAFGSGEPRWTAGKMAGDGRYAWNYWRGYECCLDGRGVFLYEIALPKTCF